ncbi:site-specific DNA-methyltransferase [Mitsuokella jalaludinii]|uniref:site-specific DNA-methyltransferase n=1 Tax=Mitsuokella jalaludinii TaxID=187979 RepID=UPI003A8F704F
MKKLTGESMNITEENLKAMQQLFPEAFEEGKIDFDVLRQLLGDFVDDEQERYSFKWNGKGKALRLSQTPSMGTLRPCKEESKDWDNTENLYIEGDNLEVLKLLQKSYYGKVKMIYIDPPYNTGGDFVYKDNFHDNIQNYKEITGQVDGEGNKIDTNTESNGRFHTDWLNMMYPRLIVARNLLAEDGVIFISIDEHEGYNLRSICEDVFGSNNYFGDLVWESTTQPINAGMARFGLQKKTEMILMYGKNKSKIEKFCLECTGELPQYPHKGKYGPCRFEIIEKSDAGDYNRPTMKFTILGQNPREGKIWQIGKETAEKLEEAGKLEIIDGIVKKAVYPEDELDKIKYAPFWSLFLADSVGTAQNGKDELVKLMKAALGFDTVKPVSLIKQLMKYMGDNFIVLDFFSGSATTAHAVMDLNVEDGGHRKFIMVQLPEPINEKSDAYTAGYKNICEIGKERIRRAGEKIKVEAGDKAADLDIGFKVFKLDSSNLQKWNPQPDDLVMTLQQATDNFLPDRTEQDVLYEIILKMGLELTCQIEEEQAAGETVYIIGGGALMICLGQNITTAVAEAVVKLHEEYESELWQVVFRDTGFASDMDKTNVKETLKAAGLDEDSFVCV